MKPIIAAAATFLALAAPAQAQLGQGLAPDVKSAADSLGQCMVAKSTGEDRIAVASWMLAAMASAPQLAEIAKIEPARKDMIDRNMAQLFTRLMTRDCAPEARTLFATKDPSAFEAAGGPLGMIAMRELLGNPQAMAALAAYAKYINEADFAALRK